MARKRMEEPAHENHERWLITYADLITLLLIYFIVMYSMSKLDMDKFKNFTESLTSVLKGTAYIFEKLWSLYTGKDYLGRMSKEQTLMLVGRQKISR